MSSMSPNKIIRNNVWVKQMIFVIPDANLTSIRMIIVVMLKIVNGLTF